MPSRSRFARKRHLRRASRRPTSAWCRVNRSKASTFVRVRPRARRPFASRRTSHPARRACASSSTRPTGATGIRTSIVRIAAHATASSPRYRTIVPIRRWRNGRCALRVRASMTIRSIAAFTRNRSRVPIAGRRMSSRATVRQRRAAPMRSKLPLARSAWGRSSRSRASAGICSRATRKMWRRSQRYANASIARNGRSH
jgi:hypothetical protein